jgi:ribonuclease D
MDAHGRTPETVPAGRFRAKLTREEINLLPIGHYQGPIRIVASAERARQALKELAGERLLGFDTETRAAFRVGEHYPPALVQLAARDAVYLFRLRPMGGPGELVGLLSDPGVVKAGVALERDLKELQAVRHFHPAGFVEIEKLADEHGIAANGLRGLAAVVMGMRISKSAQRTNWELPRLTEKQLRYAATDAWACREIYLRLAAQRP